MKFLLKRIFYFFTDNPIFAFVLFGIIVLLILAGAITRNCQNQKIKRIETNIEREKTRGIESEAAANVLANQANNQKEVIKNAENNSNLSRNSVNDVFRTDSNSFSGNFREAKKRFCEQFPNDTACR